MEPAVPTGNRRTLRAGATGRWRHPRAGTCVGIVLALLLSGVLSVSRAVADDGVSIEIVSIDDSAFPGIDVLLTANIDGRPATALTAADFFATEGGLPASVDAVTRASDADMPLAMVLTIDISGSMTGPPFAAAQEAASALVQALAGNDAVAVMSFATTVNLVQELTTDHEAALEAINAFVVAGDTALYDAVTQAAALADGSGLSRRAVVLLSDGADFGGVSATTREEALDAAASSGAIFYVVGLGPDIDEEFLAELATETHGVFLLAPEPGDVAGAFASVEEILRSQYRVRLTSTADGDDPARALTLTLVAGEAEGSASATYESLRPAVSTSTEPAATPTAAATPAGTPATAAPAPTPPANGGNGSAWALVVAPFVLAGLILGGTGWAIVRRRAINRQSTDASVARASFIRRSRKLSRAEHHQVSRRKVEDQDDRDPDS